MGPAGLWKFKKKRLKGCIVRAAILTKSRTL